MSSSGNKRECLCSCSNIQNKCIFLAYFSSVVSCWTGWTSFRSTETVASFSNNLTRLEYAFKTSVCVTSEGNDAKYAFISSSYDIIERCVFLELSSKKKLLLSFRNVLVPAEVKFTALWNASFCILLFERTPTLVILSRSEATLRLLASSCFDLADSFVKVLTVFSLSNTLSNWIMLSLSKIVDNILCICLFDSSCSLIIWPDLIADIRPSTVLNKSRSFILVADTNWSSRVTFCLSVLSFLEDECCACCFGVVPAIPFASFTNSFIWFSRSNCCWSATDVVSFLVSSMSKLFAFCSLSFCWIFLRVCIVRVVFFLGGFGRWQNLAWPAVPVIGRIAGLNFGFKLLISLRRKSKVVL